MKKNQELENRILQLVIYVFFSSDCMLLQNSTQHMHGLINMLNCANAAEKIGTDNSVESFKIKSVHMQFSYIYCYRIRNGLYVQFICNLVSDINCYRIRNEF